MGVWARGAITDTLDYHVMLANNLSQLGVDGAELDDGINTFTGALAWEPLGDYGREFGDFDVHDDLVARFGLHFTHSREDAQGQPNDDDTFENVQIRVSDGNSIFSPGLFGAGVAIRKAEYQMAAFNTGIKYRGLALEGEYYYRRIDDLTGPQTQLLSFDNLEDHGFQLIGSAMLVPRALQAYLSGSKVFGEYGNPWDARAGLNWYPFRNKSIRWNNEILYVDDSPVGGLTLPTQVGAEGAIFYSTFEVFF
jgi:hypothetical protein